MLRMGRNGEVVVPGTRSSDERGKGDQPEEDGTNGTSREAVEEDPEPDGGMPVRARTDDELRRVSEVSGYRDRALHWRRVMTSRVRRAYCSLSNNRDRSRNLCHSRSW